ncbi:MAG: glycosyltransferase family 4 protein, partial [Bacteroidota bacterium]
MGEKIWGAMVSDLRVLLIGPVTDLPRKVGGATVSFGYLIDDFRREGVNFRLVSTQHFDNSTLLNYGFVVIQVLRYLGWSNIVFLNTSRGGTAFLAPLLYLLAKIVRRKFVFRPFGGDIKDYVAHYGSLKKWIVHKTSLNADLLFLQTRALVNHYQQLGYRTEQLPTSRYTPSVALQQDERPFQKRFAFLGFIDATKGIGELLSVADQLDDSYTVQAFGAIKDEKFAEEFTQRPGFYGGVLPREEVLATLRHFDVLVLPTYYGGEGYPGVIIEAYSIGLPVIATNWKAIPEIVEDGQTGLLIEPRSISALHEAV